MPLISIITITYNAESTLRPTLFSVNGQTFDDYEHIIVDGASTDGTLGVLSDPSLANPRRMVQSGPDDGLYDAMNKGMGLSTGRYLLFLNAGDRLHAPDTLAVIARAITENDYPGVVYGQTDVVDAEGRFLRPRHLRAPKVLTLDSFRNGMLVCHQAFVALKRIAPLYNTRYRFSADYEWCVRCLQHSRRNVGLGDTVLVDYLSEGLTTANHRASLLERFRIMCHYYGAVPTVMRHVLFALRAVRRKF